MTQQTTGHGEPTATWLAHVLLALGPHCPPIPVDAFDYLRHVLRWMEQPQRSHMAFVTAEAIGWHARRHGWKDVRRVLWEEPDALPDYPPYASYSWVMRRILSGLRPRSMVGECDNDPMHAALCKLFSGSDLADLGKYSQQWRMFTLRAGTTTPPWDAIDPLIDSASLVHGEAFAFELDTRDKAAALGGPELWWAIEAYRCVAFSVVSDAAQQTLTFHPLQDGRWKAENIRSNADPVLTIAALELEERLAKATSQDAERSAQYARAAARGVRYRPDGSFYEDIAAADAEELSEVEKWFPCPFGQSPLNMLRMAWTI
jgi:hypothetical protein